MCFKEFISLMSPVLGQGLVNIAAVFVETKLLHIAKNINKCRADPKKDIFIQIFLHVFPDILE